MTIAAIAVIEFGLWSVHQVREQHKAAEREANYQTILANYTGELKPGMTRELVEQQLQKSGRPFKQMCCGAEFRGQHVSAVGRAWDDLVKIGQESAPWFCSENNIYVAFEFNPKSK